METNIVLLVAIILVGGVTLGGFIYKNMKNKSSNKSPIDLVYEYTELISILTKETLDILSIDKHKSDNEYKTELADIVSHKFYDEIQSEDDLKNSLLSKLTENQINIAILALFELKVDGFDIISLLKAKRDQNEIDANNDIEDENNDEEVKTTDISDHI